jgi:hypothetical protein
MRVDNALLLPRYFEASQVQVLVALGGGVEVAHHRDRRARLGAPCSAWPKCDGNFTEWAASAVVSVKRSYTPSGFAPNSPNVPV